MSPYNAQAIPNSGVSNGHILESLSPKPNPVIGRYFASNGWNEDSICIGGSAPPTKLGACFSTFATVAGKTPIPVSSCEEHCVCDR